MWQRCWDSIKSHANLDTRYRTKLLSAKIKRESLTAVAPRAHSFLLTASLHKTRRWWWLRNLHRIYIYIEDGSVWYFHRTGIYKAREQKTLSHISKGLHHFCRIYDMRSLYFMVSGLGGFNTRNVPLDWYQILASQYISCVIFNVGYRRCCSSSLRSLHYSLSGVQNKTRRARSLAPLNLTGASRAWHGRNLAWLETFGSLPACAKQIRGENWVECNRVLFPHITAPSMKSARDGEVVEQSEDHRPGACRLHDFALWEISPLMNADRCHKLWTGQGKSAGDCATRPLEWKINFQLWYKSFISRPSEQWETHFLRACMVPSLWKFAAGQHFRGVQFLDFITHCMRAEVFIDCWEKTVFAPRSILFIELEAKLK